MTDKIIFWLDAFLLNFCFAHDLQKKHDCELYAVVDVTNRTKKFFEEQNFVNFKKQWFLHDHIKKINSKNFYLAKHFLSRYFCCFLDKYW